MSLSTLLLALLVLSSLAFYLGRKKALSAAGGNLRTLHSLPNYYGYYLALWAGIPALAVFTLWLVLEPQIVQSLVVGGLPEAQRNLSPGRLGLLINDIRNLASGNIVSREVAPGLQEAAEHYVRLRDTSRIALVVAVLALAVAGLTFGRQRISAHLRARNQVETVVKVFLIVGSTVAVLTTAGIVFSLVFEAGRFFVAVSPAEFLFGTEWSPQIALRKDQVGAQGAFGAVPLFAGTLLISVIAMCVAMPVGLMSAIYMAEYAPPRLRTVIKPILEILAGIPTVVYGFFAALTVAPFFRDTGAAVGLTISSESALAAGIVMGIMIIPFVSSLSDDVINAVPRAMREGSYGLGATQSETIRKVIIPAALPGIVGGFLLAISRAIGETMIVVMAAGLTANMTINPFHAVTTITVQIVTLLIGDQEFDSPKTLAAFALGLVLFLITLVLNIGALRIVKKYREQYE
ncbi:MAG: phosphate ABC transporter permease subunit PstC [Defluviicoccus sp.]|nr:phosphate ABC transporter permease subunit PstC [Defluviicoccus sp.]MDG4592970.1 phosphate ABC transporter permease subunit PstC [Defluviicoccus sp.]MDS4072827.1 phosphate ABC transporter permease subunit PstC [Defluviicoccus sp.]